MNRMTGSKGGRNSALVEDLPAIGKDLDQHFGGVKKYTGATIGV